MAIQKRWVGLLILALMVTSGCQPAPNAGDLAEIDSAIGYTATRGLGLIRSIHEICQLFLTQPRWESNPALLTLPTLSYDTATGWWTLQGNVAPFALNTWINIQFRDGSGGWHKMWDADVTTIQSRGNATFSKGSCTFDITITGVQATSETLIASGSGTAIYHQQTTQFQFQNVVIRKQGNSAPHTGCMNIQIGAVTIQIILDGNHRITVTYSYQGHDHTITIDLETGKVT